MAPVSRYLGKQLLCIRFSQFAFTQQARPFCEQTFVKGKPAMAKNEKNVAVKRPVRYIRSLINLNEKNFYCHSTARFNL